MGVAFLGKCGQLENSTKTRVSLGARVCTVYKLHESSNLNESVHSLAFLAFGLQSSSQKMIQRTERKPLALRDVVQIPRIMDGTQTHQARSGMEPTSSRRFLSNVR